MTLPNDAWGLPLTTSNEAADAYRQGVDRMLSYTLGVEEALGRAIELDPGFALAHAQLGLFYLFRGQGKRAAELANQAHELADGATPREQRHVAILGATARGKGSQAPALIEEHLGETPRDAPILMQWFGANFYGGGVEKRERMLDKFDSLAPAYGDDWWFLSWHAFANHEMDQLDRARELVQRSLDLRRQNGQAAHAMSHVFFEEHDLTGGAGFLGDWLTEFPERAGFYRHLTWHQALFLLANGRRADALALHDDTIRPERTNRAMPWAPLQTAPRCCGAAVCTTRSPATRQRIRAGERSQKWPSKRSRNRERPGWMSTERWRWPPWETRLAWASCWTD